MTPSWTNSASRATPSGRTSSTIPSECSRRSISTGTMLSAYRNAIQSIYDWSPEFRDKYFPTLLQSAGQQGGTEMMTALSNYVGQHMQHSEIKALQAAGFVNNKDIVYNKVGDIKGFKPGAQLFEQDVFKKNIMQWLWDFHDAFMKRKGATEEPLAKFIERGEFSLCSRGRSGRRSGRRGPELRDAEYLIDRERQHAEHEVAFVLDRAAHAHGPCAEFILQSGVDAFGQGAKIKNDVVRIGHMDEFHALDFFGPFGLGFVLGAKVAIDDRRMAERLAVVMDGGGVVGRIH